MTVLLQVNKTSENKECTQPLVQATTSNKKLLFRAIDQLEDGGMASYSNALTFAYEAFKQVSHVSASFTLKMISGNHGSIEMQRQIMYYGKAVCGKFYNV